MNDERQAILRRVTALMMPDEAQERLAAEFAERIEIEELIEDDPSPHTGRDQTIG